MLFHVTMVHDGAHCPGYHPELMPSAMEAMAKQGEIAGRHGVKVHSSLLAAPEHVAYLIAEADSPLQLAMCLTELLPYEQSEIRVTPVLTAADAAAFMQKMGPPPGR